MGRPPASGGPAFRFMANEVSEMEVILLEHQNTMPSREVLVALAEKFSEFPERKGKIVVQVKQVWNWFQNRRYAVRAKTTKPPLMSNVAAMPIQDSTPVMGVPQPTGAPISTLTPASACSPANIVTPSVPNVGSQTAESCMEFEAKSARDGAWYDVATFMSHRNMDAGDMEVLVRFAGFGPDEDEWLTVRKNVRQRSLPCEASECAAVLPGDLILCFQEGKDQALYFDAHVLDAQRRRHDVRGCRCRFLVRYDHDQSEEIVPLRKICRRPETDYRLQQLHSTNVLTSTDQQKTSTEPSTPTAQRVVNISAIGMMQKQQNVAVLAVPQVTKANVPVAGQTVTPKSESTEISNATTDRNPNAPPSAATFMNRSTETNSAASGNPITLPQAAAMSNSCAVISGTPSAENPVALPNVAVSVNISNPVGTGENVKVENT